MIDAASLFRPDKIAQSGGAAGDLAPSVWDFSPSNEPTIPDDTTDYRYREHYRIDAEAFDYFNLYDAPATLHENQRLHQAILRQLPSPAKIILDLGCGNAWVAEALLPDQKQVISFDLAPRNVREAIRRYPSTDHWGVIGDVYDLPFRDGSIDAIVSAEVIEHVPDVPGYLTNLLRVLRPGGRIVISTPYDERIQYSLCIHCNRKTPHHAHLHSFNERVVGQIMADFPDVNYHTVTMSNKALLFLRTHVLLRHLPFGAWRWVDQLANRVINKPSRLLLILDKS